MKYKFSVKGLMVNLLIAGIIAGIGASHGSAAASMIVAVLFLAATVGKPLLPMLGITLTALSASGQDVQTAGISQEVWSSRIEANLFKNNEFLLESMDDSENVNYKTVHIPQSGGLPTVIKNRAKGGGRVDPNLRTDQEVTYDIDEYTTDPFIITNAEEVELSYPKIDSELSEQTMVLNETVAENILVSWAATGTATLPDGVNTNNNILRSSGVPNNDPTAAAVSSTAYLTGATGNRLNYGLYDIRQAKKFADKQKWPKMDRNILMSADAADQIIADLIATKYRDSATLFNASTGELSTIMGFKVTVRASVLSYTNAGTPVVKPVGAAGSAADNDAMLFWYKGFVSRAVGDIHVYETANSATDYGDIYSALVRCGGAKRRKTEVGVGVIVQTASA